MGLDKQKKMIYRIFFMLNLLTMVLSLSYIAYCTTEYVRQIWLNNETSDLYESISETPVMTDNPVSDPYASSSSDTQITQGMKLPQTDKLDSERFASLLNVNPDFLGMLLIPGLEIELPFVQGNDNSHYLEYNFNGKKSPYGTIFLDYRNSSNLADYNNVLYGHNMKNGAMFHKLSQFADFSTVQNNPVIYIDSLTGQSEWIIFAAYVCAADSGYTNICTSEESFEYLLETIHRRSIFSTNIDVNTNDNILTLSTCDYSFKNARFAVHARQKRSGEDISYIMVTPNHGK